MCAACSLPLQEIAAAEGEAAALAAEARWAVPTFALPTRLSVAELCIACRSTGPGGALQAKAKAEVRALGLSFAQFSAACTTSKLCAAGRCRSGGGGGGGAGWGAASWYTGAEAVCGRGAGPEVNPISAAGSQKTVIVLHVSRASCGKSMGSQPITAVTDWLPIDRLAAH